jgi:hypothetical protein
MFIDLDSESRSAIRFVILEMARRRPESSAGGHGVQRTREVVRARAAATYERTGTCIS